MALDAILKIPSASSGTTLNSPALVHNVTPFTNLF